MQAAGAIMALIPSVHQDPFPIPSFKKSDSDLSIPTGTLETYFKAREQRVSLLEAPQTAPPKM